MADLVRGFVERSSTVFLRRGGKTSVSSAEDVLGLLAPHVWAPGGPLPGGKAPNSVSNTEGFLSSHTQVWLRWGWGLWSFFVPAKSWNFTGKSWDLNLWFMIQADKKSGLED